LSAVRTLTGADEAETVTTFCAVTPSSIASTVLFATVIFSAP